MHCRLSFAGIKTVHENCDNRVKLPDITSSEIKTDLEAKQKGFETLYYYEHRSSLFLCQFFSALAERLCKYERRPTSMLKINRFRKSS